MKRVPRNPRRPHSRVGRPKLSDIQVTSDAVINSGPGRKVVRRRLSPRRSIKRLQNSVSSILPTIGARKSSLDSDRPAADVIDQNEEANGRPEVRHFPGKRVLGYRCKICGTHFDRSVQLKTHLFEHGSERPFPCFVCNLRFTTKWNLMKHQKCRAHRIAQSRIVSNGPDKTKSVKPIPIRKRRVEWTPVRLTCNIEPEGGGCDSVSSKNTLTLQAFPSNVSSIVPRLDQMNTCVLGSRPNIVSGTLTLNLSEHRIVTIPVSLKYEDVEACLINMGTNFDAYSTEPPRSKSRRVKQALETNIEGAHSPLTSPDFPKRDEQTAFNEKCPRPTWIHKLRTNHQDCVTLTPNQSGNGEPVTSLATPVHCSSRCQTSSTVVNSRTHEEIQAARTILSLANSGELPAFLQHPNSLCCELDGTLHQFPGSKNSDSMETTDTQVVGPRQRLPIMDCSIGPTLFPLDSQSTPSRPASIVNCVQEPHHFNPASPVTGAELALNRNSNSRRCCSPGLDEHSSPLTISPTDKTGQPTNPPILQPQANSSISTRLPRTHTSFRPPPKKRLSLHYQRNHTTAAEPSNSHHSVSEVHTSLTLTSTNTGMLASSHFLLPSTTTSTGLVPTTMCSTTVKPSVPSPNIAGGAVPGLRQMAVAPLLRSSAEASLNHSQSNVLATPSSIQYATSNIPQNVVILPQFMLLPRVISPYIPVAPGPGMVTSCFFVRPDCSVRSSTMSSTVTDSLVTPIPTTMCIPTPITSIKPLTVDSRPVVTEPHRGSPTESDFPSFLKTSENTFTGNEAEHTVVVPNGSSIRQAAVDLALNGLKSSPSVDFASSLNLTNSTTVLSSDSHRTIQARPATSVQNKRVETTASRLVSILPAGIRSCSDRTHIQSKIEPLTTDVVRLLTGRSKYRCHECGLVCHKPCLLRKHYRTHSNVRPYMCQHCDVSFKTRGNLSKHMKSRGHHDRCVRELGLIQPPLVVDDDTQVDQQALQRQYQLIFKKDAIKRDIWRSRFRAIKARSMGRVGMLGSKLPVSLRSKTRRRTQAHTKHNSAQEVAACQALELSLSHTPVDSVPEKIPAPNVNAVHLLQDLPLNLSVHPRQPAFPTPFSTVSPTQPKRALLPSHNNTSTTSPTTSWPLSVPSTCFLSKLDMTEAEEIVRTAVAAARTLNNGIGSSGAVKDDLREDAPPFSVAETFTFAHTPNSPRDTPVARELSTFPVRRDLIPCSLNPHSVSNRLTKSPTLSEVNRRSTWQSRPTSVEPNGKPELHLDALSDTSLKTPIHSRVSSAEHRTTSPSSSSLEKDLVETNGAQIQPGGTSKNSNVSSSNKLRDPRPYKCGTCQIGFRVPGHLHKHYRAKSHLVTVLNSHKLPPDTIDHIRHSRIGVSQVINPDNGQLRLRCIERLMSVKPPNTLNAAGSNHELPHRAK